MLDTLRRKTCFLVLDKKKADELLPRGSESDCVIDLYHFVIYHFYF